MRMHIICGGSDAALLGKWVYWGAVVSIASVYCIGLDLKILARLCMVQIVSTLLP